MVDGFARSVVAATRDIGRSRVVEDGVLAWFQTEWMNDPQPLAADVWVFSPDFGFVLVVSHRWRGLVPPGGAVEPGETPYEAATRELAEETGLHLCPNARPAFAAARSYRADWSPTLNLSYWTTAAKDALLLPEAGQEARWVRLDSNWRRYHAEDVRVMRAFAGELVAQRYP